jgi:hypothetical protein
MCKPTAPPLVDPDPDPVAVDCPTLAPKLNADDDPEPPAVRVSTRTPTAVSVPEPDPVAVLDVGTPL